MTISLSAIAALVADVAHAVRGATPIAVRSHQLSTTSSLRFERRWSP
jgi:hypothetical protein